jgi:hypothetical protein
VGQRQGVGGGTARRRQHRTTTTGREAVEVNGGAVRRREGGEREGGEGGSGRAVEGFSRKSDGGRFSAKSPQNRNFVNLVVEYFGARGVLRKNERDCCSGGTSLD